MKFNYFNMLLCFFVANEIAGHFARGSFGKDLLIVKERAFRRLDTFTTIPLKRQWVDWLWEEVMNPEQLYSYGGEDLRHAYLVSWPAEEELQDRVLDAIKLKYLN